MKAILITIVLVVAIACSSMSDMTLTYEQHKVILDHEKEQLEKKLVDSLENVYKHRLINFVDSIMDIKRDTVYVPQKSLEDDLEEDIEKGEYNPIRE